MFERLQRGLLILNITVLHVEPGISPALIQVTCNVVRKSECGGRNSLFVGDTMLQREETCCYSDVVTSVIRALRNKKQENSPQLL